MGEGLLLILSILFLAIYFFLVVPDYFDGILDFAFLCLTYCSLYGVSRYILSPFVFTLCRFNIGFLAIGFLLLFLLILAIILAGSWLWGGLEWEDGDWDIKNFWHVFVIFLLPSIVGLFMYIWKASFGDWKFLHKNYTLLKVQWLQQELSPHFLNNTLNIIQPLIRRKPENAIKAMNRCNQLLRYYLLQHGQKLIACQGELEQVALIHQIYELRKDQMIPMLIRGDKTLFHIISVPPMLLINLVENAFQYGDLSRTNVPVVVHIQLKKESLVVIEVANALLPKPKHSTGTRTSLKRTEDLIKLLDPKSGMMEIEVSDTTFLTRITFDMNVVLSI